MKLLQLSKSQQKTVDGIDGWLTNPEQNLLYTLAKNCKDKGVIVEIGSWKGKSTACLGFGSRDSGKNTKIISIDPHIGSPFEQQLFDKPIWTFEEFKKNMKKAKLDDLITAHVATSEEIAKKWKKPIALLWIDGSHVYKDVKKDFKLWFPHIIDGGIIVMDDTINIWGPRKVALDNLYNSKKIRNVGIVDKISYGEKTKKTTPAEQLQNKRVLAINIFSSLIWRIPTPKGVRVIGKKILQALQ